MIRRYDLNSRIPRRHIKNLKIENYKNIERRLAYEKYNGIPSEFHDFVYDEDKDFCARNVAWIQLEVCISSELHDWACRVTNTNASNVSILLYHRIYGDVEAHTDDMSKSCILIPLHVGTTTTLFVNDR